MMGEHSKKIVIVGAGGHARIVIDTAELCGFSVAGLLDFRFSGRDERILGHPVLGGPDIMETLPAGSAVFAASGDAAERRICMDRAARLGLEVPNLIHPAASVSRYASLGSGVLAAAGAVICAGAVIGSSVIVNTGASVDHESAVGDYCHIGPGARVAGRVRIGAGCFLGIGAVVIDKISIGAGVTAGAGSVVIRDIPDNWTVAGVPAARIR